MKKYYLFLLVIILSCKKPVTIQQTPETTTNYSKKKGIAGVSNVQGNCFFTKLTLESDGTYSAYWEGANVRFTNMRIYNSRVYGRLIDVVRVGGGYAPILVGWEDDVFRLFSFQSTSCVLVPPSKKTITQSMLPPGSLISNTYSSYNNSPTFGNTWHVTNNTLLIGERIANSTEFSVIELNYPTTDCGQTNVVAFKLIGIQASPGAVVEYGIASLCYDDPPVDLLVE